MEYGIWNTEYVIRKKSSPPSSYRRRPRSRRRRAQQAQRAPGCERAGHVCECVTGEREGSAEGDLSNRKKGIYQAYGVS